MTSASQFVLGCLGVLLGGIVGYLCGKIIFDLEDAASEECDGKYLSNSLSSAIGAIIGLVTFFHWGLFLGTIGALVGDFVSYPLMRKLIRYVNDAPEMHEPSRSSYRDPKVENEKAFKDVGVAGGVGGCLVGVVALITKFGWLGAILSVTVLPALLPFAAMGAFWLLMYLLLANIVAMSRLGKRLSVQGSRISDALKKYIA